MDSKSHRLKPDSVDSWMSLRAMTIKSMFDQKAAGSSPTAQPPSVCRQQPKPPAIRRTVPKRLRGDHHEASQMATSGARDGRLLRQHIGKPFAVREDLATGNRSTSGGWVIRTEIT